MLLKLLIYHCATFSSKFHFRGTYPKDVPAAQKATTMVLNGLSLDTFRKYSYSWKYPW